MDAIKFVKEQQRMCESYCCCEGCPFSPFNKGAVTCSLFISDETEKAVPLVEKWSREHPITNGDKVMKVAKNAVKLVNEYTVSLHFDRQWWDARYKE